MLIGLSGYAQSGKDTVAKFLVDNHGFERIAFADKIKELLYEMNPTVGFEYDGGGWDLRYVVDRDGWDVAKLDPEVRRLLQDLGVGARKVFGDNHWVVEALKFLDRDKNYVITDVRFQNEADWIKSVYSGSVWRVERTGVDAVNNHISEHDLDNWDFDAYIHNNSTLEDLEFAVKTTLMARI
ncbi:hypothetical protein UFOVP27_69 [uncultured Caudovirales phage]|uniref:Deoxynucleoside monophosphate kinase n=1 Tax=uncultured Caudovirales phage TaxID=2100421 RepID=A0A6J5KJ11_9CAUD|nr:hypothetical protein UFOVP27_69 [uncultured Caudovirales phage]